MNEDLKKAIMEALGFSDEPDVEQAQTSGALLLVMMLTHPDKVFLMRCIRKSDGKKALVVCVENPDPNTKEQTPFLPVAEMITGNPFAQYRPDEVQESEPATNEKPRIIVPGTSDVQ
jgi:hypothetical protein